MTVNNLGLMERNRGEFQSNIQIFYTTEVVLQMLGDPKIEDKDGFMSGNLYVIIERSNLQKLLKKNYNYLFIKLVITNYASYHSLIAFKRKLIQFCFRITEVLHYLN